MMNICNKEQNDDSVNNLLNFIGYKSEQNEISFPENLATLQMTLKTNFSNILLTKRKNEMAT